MIKIYIYLIRQLLNHTQNFCKSLKNQNPSQKTNWLSFHAFVSSVSNEFLMLNQCFDCKTVAYLKNCPVTVLVAFAFSLWICHGMRLTPVGTDLTCLKALYGRT